MRRDLRRPAHCLMQQQQQNHNNNIQKEEEKESGNLLEVLRFLSSLSQVTVCKCQ